MVTWAAVAGKWLLEGCGGEVVTGGLLRRNGYRRAVAEKWSQENCSGEMVTRGPSRRNDYMGAVADKWLRGRLKRRNGYMGGCGGETVTRAAVAEKRLHGRL